MLHVSGCTNVTPWSHDESEVNNTFLKIKIITILLGKKSKQIQEKKQKNKNNKSIYYKCVINTGSVNVLRTSFLNIF